MSAGHPPPWARQLAMLTGRCLAISSRNPVVAINAGLAIFFILVYDGSLGGSPVVSSLVGGNYFDFILPAAILAASIAGGAAGISLVTDLHSNYFYRQLTMPISRTALICATILVGGIQVLVQTVAVIGAAILLGADPDGGLVALGVICLLALLWGLGFAGYSVLVAILSRDPQITSAASVVFLPIIFLSPLLLPEEQLRPWVHRPAEPVSGGRLRGHRHPRLDHPRRSDPGLAPPHPRVGSGSGVAGFRRLLCGSAGSAGRPPGCNGGPRPGGMAPAPPG
jgi:ABC-2 type transport system permease protein